MGIFHKVKDYESLFKMERTVLISLFGLSAICIALTFAESPLYFILAFLSGLAGELCRRKYRALKKSLDTTERLLEKIMGSRKFESYSILYNCEFVMDNKIRIYPIIMLSRKGITIVHIKSIKSDYISISEQESFIHNNKQEKVYIQNPIEQGLEIAENLEDKLKAWGFEVKVNAITYLDIECKGKAIVESLNGTVIHSFQRKSDIIKEITNLKETQRLLSKEQRKILQVLNVKCKKQVTI